MALPAKISRAVYTRDDWRCRHCRNRNGLHPHHVVYQGHGGGDVLNNLLTLCWKCHRDIHEARLRLEVVELKPNDLVVKFWRLKGWKP